jgi:hypothetical protein
VALGFTAWHSRYRPEVPVTPIVPPATHENELLVRLRASTRVICCALGLLAQLLAVLIVVMQG